MSSTNGTDTPGYTAHLKSSEALWKQLLGVQRIYAWNLRRLEPGFLLDLGCGIGRNLRAVSGRGVGIDHNEHSVAVARERGFDAYTPEAFRASSHAQPERFDTLLVSHVLEHLTKNEAEELVQSYLPYLRRGGLFIAITPQERGYRSDSTHCRFVRFEEVDELSTRLGLRPLLRRSFPFPRPVGRWFTYNEFVTVARKP